MTGERDAATAAEPEQPAERLEPDLTPTGGIAVIGRPRVLAPTLACLVSVLLVALTWKAFVTTPRGQMVEEAARIGSAQTRESLFSITGVVLSTVSVPGLVLVLAGAVIAALLQRRWSIAIAAVVVLCGANLTTQILQEWLRRPADDLSAIPLNSFPSGHATVGASIAATALLVVPTRGRSAVAILGALLSTALGLSTMIGDKVGAWHRASDVIAAFLIAAAWYFAAEAILAALVLRNPAAGTTRLPRTRVATRVLTALGGLFVALGAGALGASAVRAPITTDVGHQIAFLGSMVGVAGAACLIHSAMLRLRPHHLAPRPPDIDS